MMSSNPGTEDHELAWLTSSPDLYIMFRKTEHTNRLSLRPVFISGCLNVWGNEYEKDTIGI